VSYSGGGPLPDPWLRRERAWCKENNKRGYAAAHRLADDGEWFWPLVTEGSCNRRLDGRVNIDHPYSSHAVLTPEEEQDLVETCKELNAGFSCSAASLQIRQTATRRLVAESHLTSSYRAQIHTA